MIRTCALLTAVSISAFAASPEQEIRAVMDNQVAAWNHGDIEAFATGYEHSPRLLFVGKSLAHGYQEMVARYKHEYPTPAKMGKLSFSELEVAVLCPEWANVVGRFRLNRDSQQGGNAQGRFTLLFHHTANGWHIIQDHTS